MTELASLQVYYIPGCCHSLQWEQFATWLLILEGEWYICLGKCQEVQHKELVLSQIALLSVAASINQRAKAASAGRGTTQLRHQSCQS